jgi:hypothetical protein
LKWNDDFPGCVNETPFAFVIHHSRQAFKKSPSLFVFWFNQPASVFINEAKFMVAASVKSKSSMPASAKPSLKSVASSNFGSITIFQFRQCSLLCICH